MTRPSPSQARAIAIGISIPLAVALVTAFVRSYDHSKLDTIRFERDSITRDYKEQIQTGLLFRIDSATKRIEAHEGRDHGVR